MHVERQGRLGDFVAGISQGRDRRRAMCHIVCVDPRELAEWILADGLNARLGLQIHKFIWEPSLKGV